MKIAGIGWKALDGRTQILSGTEVGTEVLHNLRKTEVTGGVRKSCSEPTTRWLAARRFDLRFLCAQGAMCDSEGHQGGCIDGLAGYHWRNFPAGDAALFCIVRAAVL